MGVIQYRRGERFDRVIVSKNEDHRPSSMTVKLNSHLQTAAGVMASPSTLASLSGGDKRISAVIRAAIEDAAKKSKDPALRELFSTPSSTGTATVRTAPPPAESASNQNAGAAPGIGRKKRIGMFPFLIFLFIAFQVLRVIFAD